MEEEIERAPLREKEIVEDKRLPIAGCNYSALRDRLKKQGIKPGVSDPIPRYIHGLCHASADVAHIIITYHHVDHVGSLSALKGAT